MYIETLKTLLHVSIIRSSSGSILCALLKLQFKTLSDLLLTSLTNYLLMWCCGCTSRVMCESYDIDSRSQLNIARLKHNTGHAVTAPN